jgi:hypothetical protein
MFDSNGVDILRSFVEDERKPSFTIIPFHDTTTQLGPSILGDGKRDVDHTSYELSDEDTTQSEG